MTSSGLDYWTKEEAEERERSPPSVALLCAGQLRIHMVCDLKLVVRECDGFSATYQCHMMAQCYCDCCGTCKETICDVTLTGIE